MNTIWFKRKFYQLASYDTFWDASQGQGNVIIMIIWGILSPTIFFWIKTLIFSEEEIQRRKNQLHRRAIRRTEEDKPDIRHQTQGDFWLDLLDSQTLQYPYRQDTLRAIY